MLSISFDPFPEIQTERLFLRQITNDDAQDVFALRSDEKVMEYIDRPRATTIDDAIALIEKINKAISENEGINWGITLKGDKTVIGMISYHRIEKENYRGEIGYLLRPDQHRKGIMQEAISAVIDFGFDQLHFHSIEAKINPGNNASRQILEKNGFVKEAYFKENYYWDGKFLDTGVYSLLSPKKSTI